MASVLRWGLALRLGVPLLTACAGAPVPHGIPPGPRPVAAALDSVDGTVQVSGSMESPVVLLLRSDAAALRLIAADTALLRAMDGLTVRAQGQWVAAADPTGAGPAAAARFRVAQLRVRAVEGLPALDGVLAHEDGHWVLRSAEGVSYRLPAPLPEPLTGLVGARIFWAGALDAPPRAYGVLQLPGDQRRR